MDVHIYYQTVQILRYILNKIELNLKYNILLSSFGFLQIQYNDYMSDGHNHIICIQDQSRE